MYEGHSVLVPYMYMKCPQFINHPNLVECVLKFYYQNIKRHQDYIIAYNSNGAQNNVNHLHFEMMDLTSIKKQNNFTKMLYGEWHIENSIETKLKKSKKTGF